MYFIELNNDILSLSFEVFLYFSWIQKHFVYWTRHIIQWLHINTRKQIPILTAKCVIVLVCLSLIGPAHQIELSLTVIDGLDLFSSDSNFEFNSASISNATYLLLMHLTNGSRWMKDIYERNYYYGKVLFQ